MNLYAVSFFGHRQIDNVFVIEQRLEMMIRKLLVSKEYVEFLVGRDGEFDQLVASTVRRCKRAIRDDNSALVLVLPYATAEYRNNESRSMSIMMRLRSALNPQKSISSQLIKPETVLWLTVQTWLFFVWNTTQVVPIKPCNMRRK